MGDGGLADFDPNVAKRYHVDKRLGRGAYGIVWKARSKKSDRVVTIVYYCLARDCGNFPLFHLIKVAVKKIFDAFRNKTDAQRTFREIVFLKAFRDHPNIVRLFNVHPANNHRDLYLVFEYMNT